MKKVLRTNYNLNDIVIIMNRKESNMFYIYIDNIFLFPINIDDYYIASSITKSSDSNNKYLVLCSILRL
jgi:hypothetical protein